MNRKQIYKTIADAYYCELEERTLRQKGLATYGICNSLNRFSQPYSFLMKFITGHRSKAGRTGHLLPTKNWRWEAGNHTRRHDLIRADFCTLMSLLTDSEYEEISK